MRVRFPQFYVRFARSMHRNKVRPLIILFMHISALFYFKKMYFRCGCVSVSVVILFLNTLTLLFFCLRQN